MDSDNTRQNPGMFGRVGDRKHSPAIAEFLIPITKVFWRAKLSLRGPALLNKPQFSLCPCLVLGLNPIFTALFTVCAGHLPDSYHIVHVLFFEIPVFQCLCIYSIYPSIQDSFVFRRGTKFLSFIQN